MTSQMETSVSALARFPKRVVVVGGGIAGLTAAHELVARGYEVEVIEKMKDPQENSVPLLGGMARSRWARAALPPERDFTQPSPAPPHPGIGPGSIDQLPIGEVSAPVVVPYPDDDHGTGPNARAAIKRRPFPEKAISLVNCCALFGLPLQVDLIDARREEEGPPQDDNIAEIVRTLYFKVAKEGDPFQATQDQLDATLIVIRHVQMTVDQLEALDAELRRDDGKAGAVLSVGVDMLPGEHGFRFFPSFYRNLFETMKQIPLRSESRDGAAKDTFRTVFDNLVPAPRIEFALLRKRRPSDPARTRTFSVRRHRLSSFRELREFIHDTLERAGYRGQDLHRFTMTCVRYLTSSSKRREQYEEQTWIEFAKLDAGRCSQTFAEHVESGAQVLVAMSASTSDARTIGSISLQLILDHLRGSSYVDGALNGPTSVSFIWPWEEHLTAQGVKFTQGELVGFDVADIAARPRFVRANGLDVRPADYYVITIPASEVKKACMPPPSESSPLGTRVLDDSGRDGLTALREANDRCIELDVLRGFEDPVKEKSDLDKYIDFEQKADGDENDDSGSWRSMAGIQFYFDDDVLLPRGHTLCLESAWGVSYLSQTHYWQDRRRSEDGARGVVSAIFTRFTAKFKDKTVRECTPKEIAERVWSQIAACWNIDDLGPPPLPRAFAIDENLQFDSNGKFVRNTIPYLVNLKGRWSERPGDRDRNGKYKYRLQLGNTVFAGVFMRTATRLNTMECANESGKRAANAIFRRDSQEIDEIHERPESRGSAFETPIYDLEDEEIEDLQPLIDVDEKLVEQGRRHMLDSPWAEVAARVIPWDLGRLVARRHS